MAEVAVVVGNPKPRSRTRLVAEAVATAAATAAGLAEARQMTFDLADLGPQLFNSSSPEVRRAIDAVRACALVVVASPTYKASYTGLLKSFLDWFGTADMANMTVVPLMVGAAPQHALAVEVHLRPLLLELGATLPTRGLFVLEDQFGELDGLLSNWLAEAGPRLRASVSGTR